LISKSLSLNFIEFWIGYKRFKFENLDVHSSELFSLAEQQLSLAKQLFSLAEQIIQLN